MNQSRRRDFQIPGADAKFLPPEFIKSYTKYRRSRLPRVGALLTLPIVLPNGLLLFESGLHRDLNVVMKTDEALSKRLAALGKPRPHDRCSGQHQAAGKQVADAHQYGRRNSLHRDSNPQIRGAPQNANADQRYISA